MQQEIIWICWSDTQLSRVGTWTPCHIQGKGKTLCGIPYGISWMFEYTDDEWKVTCKRCKRIAHRTPARPAKRSAKAKITR